MRLAIIGGGAAGLTSAHYLSKNHEVVLFKKEATLGGNIRTLGLNEPIQQNFSNLEKLTIDNGVIEFIANRSPYLDCLLEDLNITSKIIKGGSTTF